MKLYCRQCSGKAYRTKWNGDLYYIPIFMGEIVADKFIYRPPSKCKVCKARSVYIKGIAPDTVDTDPQETLVVLD